MTTVSVSVSVSVSEWVCAGVSHCSFLTFTRIVSFHPSGLCEYRCSLWYGESNCPLLPSFDSQLRRPQSGVAIESTRRRPSDISEKAPKRQTEYHRFDRRTAIVAFSATILDTQSKSHLDRIESSRISFSIIQPPSARFDSIRFELILLAKTRSPCRKLGRP